MVWKVPESQSNTSDEDEDEHLDPTEFLSHDIHIANTSSSKRSPALSVSSAEIKHNSPTLKIDPIPTTTEQEFFSNPSVISDEKGSSGFITVDNLEGIKRKPNDDSPSNRVMGNSYSSHINTSKVMDSFESSSAFQLPEKLFGVQRQQDSPLEYLINRGKLLEQELITNASKQRQMLQSGDFRIHRIRDMISQNFDQISENCTFLAEVYTKELKYTKKMFESFENWNLKREKILGKISTIKSNKTKYGRKLDSLIEKSEQVDQDIVDLERKLQTLREKKALIGIEIQETSSVLESRTSTYVQMFKDLEKEGEVAIHSLLDQNGLPKIEQQNFIKRKPVDVTFTRKRAHKSFESGKLPNAAATSASEFVSDAPQPIASETNLKPFEHGYSIGTRQSQLAKLKLSRLVNGLLQSSTDDSNEKVPESKELYLDDINNTINEKIDYDHIRTLLNSSILALEDVIKENNTKSISSHECGVIWKDILKFIRHSEDSLYSVISNATSDLDSKEKSIPLLSKTLELLCERYELLINSINTSQLGSNPISFVIFNEMDAISMGLNLLSNSTDYSQKIDCLKSEVGFKYSNFNYKTTVPSGPTGFMNKVSDHRKRAELELSKSKDNAPIMMSRPISTKKDKEL